MFKINDYVVYKRSTCIISDDSKGYFTLLPIDDKSLSIKVPKDNKNNLIRKVISELEAEKIISEILEIEPVKMDNEKFMEQEYKKLLATGSHKDLIKIIKTTYLRNADRLKNNKKSSEKDEIYFKEAERILYNEFSIALNMTNEEVKEHIISKLENL